MMKKFADLMRLARNDNFKHDENRSKNRGKSKRYEALAFPAYHGSPVMFNVFIFAWIYSLYRSLDYAECRIIDKKTGKHYVF